jgi:hypothetical protein
MSKVEKLEEPPPDPVTGRRPINEASFDKKFRRPFDKKLVEGLKPEQITWNQHIRGLFTLNQAKCMREVNETYTLTDYDKMKLGKVNEMISGKKMPKANPWPDFQIKLFNDWVIGGCKLGNPVNSDPNDKVNKIMDPPLPFEIYTTPEAFETNAVKATYLEHIVHIFADSDVRAWQTDFKGEEINSYELFKKAAEDYEKVKNGPESVGKKNLIYAILHDIFPDKQPWQKSWKSVLRNWIENGYDRGISSSDAPV